MSDRPQYVTMEPKEREQLLSQTGRFSPEERSLFHKLCDAWEPAIDVQRFNAKNDLISDRQTAVLDRLIARLQRHRMGLYRTVVEGQERRPTSIVLTDPNDALFSFHLLQEAFDELSRGVGSGLPEVTRLTERGVAIPGHHATDADSAMLVAATQEGQDGDAKEPRILRMRLLDGYTILVPAPAVRSLMTNTLRWLRHAVDDPSVLDEVARALDKKASELRNRLRDRNTAFWNSVCRTIVAERQTIAYRTDTSEKDDLFQAAFLMMSYIEAQSGADEKKETQREQVEEELRAIEGALRQASDVLDGDEFARLVATAEERLGKLSAEFHKALETKLLRPRPRRTLATIRYIHGDYLHRDNAYPLFQRLRAQVAAELHREYVDIMEQMLRGTHPEYAEYFESRSAFEADIAKRAQAHAPLIAEFLDDPQMLAEALVHHTKLKQQAVTPESLRGILGELFDVRSSSLIELAIVFSLSMVGLFDEAFARLGVLRQLWHRLSGRYESMRDSYRKRTVTDKRAAGGDGDAKSSSVSPGREEPAEPPGMRTAGTGPRKRGEAVPTRPRPKTRRQVDRAWQEFGQALKKK